MQLILAIDSDPRRSEQLAAVVRARLQVELVQASSAGDGLLSLRDRVPDLILTSPLLSPFDDGVLDEYLRDLGSAATHVQTLRIPMLSASPKKKSAARSLFSLVRKKTETVSSAPDGCDPKVFADEIAHYLTRSTEQRSTAAKAATERAAVDARQPHQALAPEPIVELADEPVVHDPLVEEFMRADEDVTPIYQPTPVSPIDEPAPVYEPVYATSEPSSPYDLVVDEPDDWKEDAREAAPEPQPNVEPPVAARQSEAISGPPEIVTPAAVSAPSPSFEAALAAIRAAWTNPDGTRPAQTNVR